MSQSPSILLASHNSFSYLRPRHWWMRLFFWMARCQKVDIAQQELLGVRMYDLRVRFDHNKKPVICHGLMQYEAIDLDSWLGLMNRTKDHYMRVVLETKSPNQKQEIEFILFCGTLEHKYPNIKFFGGNNRTDWSCQNPIYDFKQKLPQIDHKYSSTTTLFPNAPAWLTRIDDLYPYLYARLHNKQNYANPTPNRWLMLDFVNLR